MNGGFVFLSLYTALMGVCVLFALWTCWGMYCNSRTFNERQAILDKTFGFMESTRQAEQFWAMRGEFQAVSYDQHLKAHMRLKDWRKLYGPLIHEVMGWTE